MKKMEARQNVVCPIIYLLLGNLKTICLTRTEFVRDYEPVRMSAASAWHLYWCFQMNSSCYKHCCLFRIINYSAKKIQVLAKSYDTLSVRELLYKLTNKYCNTHWKHMINSQVTKKISNMMQNQPFVNHDLVVTLFKPFYDSHLHLHPATEQKIGAFLLNDYNLSRLIMILMKWCHW